MLSRNCFIVSSLPGPLSKVRGPGCLHSWGTEAGQPLKFDRLQKHSTLTMTPVGVPSSKSLGVDHAATGLREAKKFPHPRSLISEFYARSVGAEVISLPLTHEFAHDVQGMLGKIASSTTLIYICNPNNPTGSITPRKGLEDFISKLPSTVFVVIDEAYHHYAGQSSMYASLIDNPVNNSRVIVSRTFSTVYGLAGLRLGYGITSPETARHMRRLSRKVRWPPWLTRNQLNSM